MVNKIISYIEMCQKKGVSLQKGMNFQIGKDYSVILMSVRPNSSYRAFVKVRSERKKRLIRKH